MGLEAGIWALRLGFGPRDWDLGLETGIWASRLEFGPRDWILSLETGVLGGDGGEGEGENSSLGSVVFNKTHGPNFVQACLP